MRQVVYNWGALVLLAVGVVLLTVTIAHRYIVPSRAVEAARCMTPGSTHYVVIKDDAMQPGVVSAKLCDSLSILNQDSTLRLLTVGDYNHHQTYDGVTQQVLAENQSLTIVLNQAGTYHFHDHLHPQLTGSFSVAP